MPQRPGFLLFRGRQASGSSMNPLTFPMPVGRARTRPVPPLGVLGGSKPPCRPVQGFLRVENGCAGPLVSARRSFGAAPTNLQALPSRDRNQPQADRSEKPHQAAVPSWPGSSPLPRSVWLGQLSAGNKPPIAAVSLRPELQEVPPPTPFRFALWFRRGLGSGVHDEVIIRHCCRISGSCRD